MKKIIYLLIVLMFCVGCSVKLSGPLTPECYGGDCCIIIPLVAENELLIMNDKPNKHLLTIGPLNRLQIPDRYYFGFFIDGEEIPVDSRIGIGAYSFPYLLADVKGSLLEKIGKSATASFLIGQVVYELDYNQRMSIKNYITVCNKDKEDKLINLKPITKTLLPWGELMEADKQITISLFPEMVDNFGKPITVYLEKHEFLEIDIYKDKVGYIYYTHWFEKE